MTHRTSNVSLTPNAMNGTKHFLVRQAAWSFGSLFVSPVFNVAGRLATMGSGRNLRFFFFLDAGGEEKRHQSASLTLCQRVTGPHLREFAALKWNKMPTPISYSTWVHLSLVPGLENLLVAKLVFSLI